MLLWQRMRYTSTNMSTLYIVSTPIGNMGDMTYRAIEVLRSVDTILCEDTRVTGKLLKYYEIDNLDGSGKLMSYHANSSLTKVDQVIRMLQSGKNLALVSDAGTPTISDPGVLLIQAINHLVPESKIVSVPGASAVVAALSLSGFIGNSFCFKGFVPHKKGRETLFKEIAVCKDIVIIYESPHRILKTLSALSEHLGERELCLAREITKLHEQTVRGTATEVRDYFEQHSDKVRGEFVLVIDKLA